MGAIKTLAENKVDEKLSIVSHWTSMSFPLALTRANGSDTYTNQRALIYGKRMEKLHDITVDTQGDSEKVTSEAGSFYEEFVNNMQVIIPYYSC